MAAKAPSFDACGVTVDVDAVKGKVVISQRDIAAGEVIFSEQAFVAATWSTNVCDGCDADKSEEPSQCKCDTDGAPFMYSEVLTKNVEKRNDIVQLMAALESIGEVDRARCVLKCLAMVERDSKALEQVLTLTCANLEQCLADATELLELAPEILPKGFTAEQLATLMGVLNTNSHELENLGGSGLFLSACRMEHNCAPNCSFTTYDSTLWMTAIRPIAKGEALSIDYGNFFYRPTDERMTSLLESYGFVCSCDACLKEPDTCRSFKCPTPDCEGKTDSVIYPYPNTPKTPLEDPEELKFSWKCCACGYVPNEAEVDSFEAAEQELLEAGFPETLQEVDELIKKTPLHERHYLLFWAMDAIGCEAAEIIPHVMDDEGYKADAAAVWKRIIAALNAVVPNAHHEKTIYYDNLAQVQVVLGDLEAAKAAYREAFEIACVVSGRDCTPTQKLLDLSQNPPANAEELRKVYANVKRREHNEDDDEEWEDEEEDEEEEDEE